MSARPGRLEPPLLSALFDSPVLRGNGLPVVTDALDLLLAFVLGMCLAWTYMASHRGLSYSRNLVHSLVQVPMITTMVMLLVTHHIARGFGLAASMGLVRWRTVMRDPRDTTFVFLALGMGIAVGAQQHLIALLGTAGVAATAYAMPATSFVTRASDSGMLRVRGAADAGPAIEAVLATWCKQHKLVAMRHGEGTIPAEFAYEIQLHKPSERNELVKAVKAVEGAIQATIVIEEKGEEW